MGEDGGGVDAPAVESTLEREHVLAVVLTECEAGAA